MRVSTDEQSERAADSLVDAESPAALGNWSVLSPGPRLAGRQDMSRTSALAKAASRPVALFLSALFAVTLAGSAHADSPPSPIKKLSLRQAIEEAQLRMPAIRAALARVEAQKAEARIPSAEWMPRIGATAQLLGATANNTTASYLNVPESISPRLGATAVDFPGNLKPYASSYLSLTVDQQLFDFGRVAAQSAARDALVIAESERARATSLDILFQAEESFYAVAAARAILRSAQDAVQRSRAHRDLARAGVASGLRTPIELTRAEADVARFENGLLRAVGGLQSAEEVLGASIGEDGPVDIAEESATPPASPSLSEAVRIASERDPSVRYAMAAMDAQRKESVAIGSVMRPQLDLLAGLSGRAGGAPASNGREPEGAGLLPYVPNYFVSLVLRVPIYDGSITALREASQARERVRLAEVAAALHEVNARARQAWIELSVAERTLPGLERSVDAARANHAQAEARFAAGMGTSVELADAEMLRTDAEIQLAVGRFGVARARAALGRAMAERL